MLTLLLFAGGGNATSGGTITYPSPILLMKRGTLAIHLSNNEYLEI